MSGNIKWNGMIEGATILTGCSGNKPCHGVPHQNMSAMMAANNAVAGIELASSGGSTVPNLNGGRNKDNGVG